MSFDDFLGQCGNVLYRSKSMLLCRLPDFKSQDVGLQIEAWGPQLTSLHTVPNRQVIGGAAFWIRVKQVNWQKLGPLRLHLSGQPAFTTKLGDGLITGRFPDRLFRQPGTYELQVKQLVGGRFFDVGQFHVLGEIAPIDSLPDTVIAELVAWGPRSGEVGAGFNRQAGGRSAMWFRFSDIGQHPYRIYFGTNPLRTSVSGDKNVITASTTAEQAARLTANPREIPVHLVDLVQGGKQVLGYFLVSGR